jgi:3D-(3,5/4)-trihydroxycyclohexane-1,2-dione acylhydrolase (decyclizing)
MMSSELVTAVQERLPLIVVLVQNHGFASIGALSASVGSQRFGTAYRYRDQATGRLDGAKLPVDLAANAQSLGATVIRAATIADLKAALAAAKSAAKSNGGPVVIHVETDPLVPAPDSQSWWDVPIAEVSGLDSVTSAEQAYRAARTRQRRYL